MIEKLSDEARALALADLPEWLVVAEPDGISRRFTFPDFVAAFGFMTQVAILAENRVDMVLTTHDAGGLSQRDIDLAHQVDGLL